MKDLTLISCSYNTPEVTETMLKSWTQYHPDVNILIAENSTDESTVKILEDNKIPFLRNPKGLHAPSVDNLLGWVRTDYALLVDTDVIFHKDHSGLLDIMKSMDLTIMGNIVGDRGGKRLHKRVNPWHCLINVKKIKENNIKFYDKKRLESRDAIRYDVGSSFFEDIKNLNLKIGNVDVEKTYYTHIEGLSWRTKRYNPTKPDGDIDNSTEDTHSNYGLYAYGLLAERQFDEISLKYKNLKINYNGTHNL